MNPSPILQLFAWIVTDTNGLEGIGGFQMPGFGWVQMCGADINVVNKMRGVAMDIATRPAVRGVRLVRFDRTGNIEELP